ncbi:hypothetical protein H0X06_03065 [Candidatus Dependentiae bacterium]|nr:hypothetical protein [Candidatus Dependentiae bacterium]
MKQYTIKNLLLYKGSLAVYWKNYLNKGIHTMTLYKAYTRRKYSSLFLSVLIHALLCTVLLYWATRPQDYGPFSQEKFPSPGGPAKISFQRFPSSSGLPLTQKNSSSSLSSSSTLRTVPQATRKTVLSQAHPKASPKKKTAQHKPSLPPKAVLPTPKSIVQQETPLHPAPSAVIEKETPLREVDVEETDESRTDNALYTPPEDHFVPSLAGDHPSKENIATTSPSAEGKMSAGSSTGRIGRSGITGAALVHAFRGSYHADRRGSSEQSQSASTVPEHVARRMEEWNYYSYKEKIGPALIKAERMHKKYIKTDTPIYKKLSFRLSIDEQGTMTAQPLQELTGIDEIDQYIIQLFSLVDLPPIPKRFKLRKLDTYTYTIEVILPPGGGFVHITTNQR